MEAFVSDTFGMLALLVQAAQSSWLPGLPITPPMAENCTSLNPVWTPSVELALLDSVRYQAGKFMARLIHGPLCPQPKRSLI